MAKKTETTDKKTSPKVASRAGRVLADPKSSAEAKSIAFGARAGGR
jgi:hypothetical protein